MSRLSVDLSPKEVIDSIYQSELKDEEVQQHMIHAIAKGWNWTEELDTDFIARITALLVKEIAATKASSINYGGSPKWNMEYAEKELKAGRKPDKRRFSNAGN